MTRDEMLEEIALREEIRKREIARWGIVERIAFIRENKSREQRGEERLPYPWVVDGCMEVSPETQAAIDRIRQRLDDTEERKKLEQDTTGVILTFEGDDGRLCGTDTEEAAQIKEVYPERTHIVVQFVSPGDKDNAI